MHGEGLGGAEGAGGEGEQVVVVRGLQRQGGSSSGLCIQQRGGGLWIWHPRDPWQL